MNKEIWKNPFVYSVLAEVLCFVLFFIPCMQIISLFACGILYGIITGKSAPIEDIIKFAGLYTALAFFFSVIGFIINTFAGNSDGQMGVYIAAILLLPFVFFILSALIFFISSLITCSITAFVNSRKK